MTTEHPITPSPGLIDKWRQEYTTNYSLARQAARWGADTELEANCEWLEKGPYGFTITASAPHMISDLRAARRPKPPSLAEQALMQLQAMEQAGALDCNIDAIRAALERLKELEKGNE